MKEKPIILLLFLSFLISFIPVVPPVSAAYNHDINVGTIHISDNATGAITCWFTVDDWSPAGGDGYMKVYYQGTSVEAASSSQIFGIEDDKTFWGNATSLPSESNYQARIELFSYGDTDWHYSEYTYFTWTQVVGNTTNVSIGEPLVLDRVAYNQTWSTLTVGAQVVYNASAFDPAKTAKVKIFADTPTEAPYDSEWHVIPDGGYYNNFTINVPNYYCTYDVYAYLLLFDGETENFTYSDYSDTTSYSCGDEGDPYEGPGADDEFAGYPYWVWQTLFSLGIIMFFFMLPSIVASKSRSPMHIPPIVNVMCGFMSMIGLTVFGWVPIWVNFMFALVMIVYVVYMLRR